MFSEKFREKLRKDVLDFAKQNQRVTGCAITGSVTIGKQDKWSDIDLAFGCDDSIGILPIMNDFSKMMAEKYEVVHTLEVPWNDWIYKVFLLSNTLQVDLAFAPAKNFGAKAETFELVSGKSNEPSLKPKPKFESIIGWGWLYALHVRTSIARERYWQAEYYLSGMRDQVISLACLKNELPTHEARGVDELDEYWKDHLSQGLVRTIEKKELQRAFKAVNRIFLSEVEKWDKDIQKNLRKVLDNLIYQNEI